MKILNYLIWQILTNVSEVLTVAIIKAMMIRGSETSVNIYQTTRRNISEDFKINNVSCVIYAKCIHEQKGDVVFVLSSAGFISEITQRLSIKSGVLNL
jgi:vacuolar-type H+-ATPase subunit C/Vma6